MSMECAICGTPLSEHGCDECGITMSEIQQLGLGGDDE
jgi:hypothetical protein